MKNEEKEIIVTKRRDDYHVCLKDKPAVWACGKSSVQAIGTLVSDHPSIFGIKINYDKA